MHLNEHFINGFIKAALTNPGNISQPKPAPKPSPPPIQSAPSPNPAPPPPLANTPPPQVLPTQPPTNLNHGIMPQYDGWKLRGYAKSNNGGTYDYQDTAGKYHLMNHELGEGAQSLEDFNNDNSISNEKPVARQAITPEVENQALRSAYSNLGKPDLDLNRSANDILGDPYTSVGLPRVDSVTRGGSPEPDPNELYQRLQHNMTNNNGLFDQLQSAANGLPGRLWNSDPGIHEQGMGQLLQMVKHLATTNPPLAQELYQKYFGQN
jgi:hypothetical protein